MSAINGYRLKGELTTQNAGFCQWGFCEKDGHEFFIKEFLSPVYPVDKGDLSQQVIERKRNLCNQFYNEKKAFYDTLQACRSGNNVVILDFFRSGSKYYIVTDKVNVKGTDPKLISQLSEDKRKVFLKALLFSVWIFHGAGIVHADLKPDNILLKETVGGYYTGKIIDFDAGFLVNSVPSEVQGDFVYLSPEVYLKMAEEEAIITEKIDIFALGLLLHQYWTGELPTFSKEYKYAFEAVLDDAQINISNRIPTSLRDQIGRMLDKNPTQRPSADKVLNTIQALDGIPNKEPEPAQSFESWSVSKEGTVRTYRGFYVPKDLE